MRLAHGRPRKRLDIPDEEVRIVHKVTHIAIKLQVYILTNLILELFT